MKTVLIIFLACIGLISRAQTAIIAHKSHSGTAVNFFTDPNTNFGDPGPQLIQLVRLNDSTYIEVFSSFSGMIYHDTVRKNSQFGNYNKDVDSIYQQGYYSHIEYINLKTSRDTGRIKTPNLRIQHMIEESETSPQKPDFTPAAEEKSIPKKKKKSYLLFLFGITGGGMLLMKLFSKSEKIQQSIA
jgi:hypothetical protein